ncbi:esterase-like activity of phytase family protein [Aquimarina sp. 2201CG14-23]|uniref:esterase-like activity of phytase family protein n=1 Tax=Aquimarina mycalae TaxID=3040073 RepID=UPI002477EB3B|nr:esterase-like activity of phytase family protein [Aquimarina sp. 2201CG14-23]MDH7446713.1 esterase-like activity of phytase family protein [Aquimarina sp. 2201CG14-23]
MIAKITYFILVIILCTNCSSSSNTSDDTQPPVEPVNTISNLEYIDEFIIPVQNIDGVPIGGFSGIDYKNGNWYIISDGSDPIRYYTADISYNQDQFTNVSIHTMIEIKDALGNSFSENQVDPEAIRFDTSTGNLIYTSEGAIANGINPALLEITTDGNQLQSFTLPNHLAANTVDDLSGPRHNGALEALSISFDTNAYWIGMELPLIEDGPEPTITETESPVRVTRIDKSTKQAERQFAYELDPVDRAPALGTTFTINGLVEILEYDENKFLAIERSFSSGYLDGGNTVKIYKVDATNATNTLTTTVLSAGTYTKATKTLLFEFEDIRNQLTNGIVDNIEGITFGPTLIDGSKSLVVVSDNNFNAFLPQLNQLIVFRVVP